MFALIGADPNIFQSTMLNKISPMQSGIIHEQFVIGTVFMLTALTIWSYRDINGISIYPNIYIFLYSLFNKFVSSIFLPSFTSFYEHSIKHIDFSKIN